MTGSEFVGPVGNASDKYGARNPVIRTLLRRFLVDVDATVLSLEPSSLLDVGCGEGVVTERLSALLPGVPVIGVDADDAVLAAHWRQRQRENLSFRTGSGYALPFDDDTHDVVCAFEVLEHVERPRSVLAEMERVAKQAIVISVPREPLWRLSHLLAGRNVLSFGNTPGHINHWSSAAFARLLSEYGMLDVLRRPFPWLLAVVRVEPAPSPTA